MADPTTHAQALADLVTQHGYDGIELDYEHLWSSADRPGFVALVAQVAAALHAQGKLLSLALPAMDHDDGNNAYDYVALQQSADVLHLMGYDFHWLGGPHLGPLAPLGWVSDVVTRVETSGAPAKYVLGVANYAIGDGWYSTAVDAVEKCGAGYFAPDRPHAHLLARPSRGGLGAALHHGSQGDLWFEDAVSAGEKAPTWPRRTSWAASVTGRWAARRSGILRRHHRPLPVAAMICRRSVVESAPARSVLVKQVRPR